MALRGRRINNFLELWCLVALGGLDIWVSSTSFQKSNIGRPQQPLKEKVLKFNMIFHDSTKKIFFLKHQNKAEFKNLDDFEVLSSDFPDLRTSAASVTSAASTTSVASMTLTASFHQKNTDPDGCSSLALKWPILVPFYRMYHQKSNFSLILAPFLSEAVEARRCYFFENWLMKLKFPSLLKLLGTII